MSGKVINNDWLRMSRRRRVVDMFVFAFRPSSFELSFGQCISIFKLTCKQLACNSLFVYSITPLSVATLDMMHRGRSIGPEQSCELGLALWMRCSNDHCPPVARWTTFGCPFFHSFSSFNGQTTEAGQSMPYF